MLLPCSSCWHRSRPCWGSWERVASWAAGWQRWRHNRRHWLIKCSSWQLR
jgi:hypothetical protein